MTISLNASPSSISLYDKPSFLLLRNQKEGNNFVYNNDIAAGPLSQNCTTFVSATLVLDFNGLLQSCTNYQWQSRLFEKFIW